MNPKKYRGDPSQVIYRSLWERKLMVYCDKNTSVIEWGSEEIIIPYRSPKDGRIHRYFPDFYMKVKQKNGTTKKFVIEVKPKAQCKEPVKNPKRRTKKWLNEVFLHLHYRLRPFCKFQIRHPSCLRTLVYLHLLLYHLHDYHHYLMHLFLTLLFPVC